MEITVDVSLVCSVCKNEIYGKQDRYGNLEVDPCEICMRDARDDGVIEGEANAEKEGRNEE